MTPQLILRRHRRTFGQVEVCAMSWEDDRDTLIAQTMEFVQSVVNRRQGGAETAARLALLPAVEALHLNAAPAETSVFAPVRMAELPPTAEISAPAPRLVVRGEMASEIRARIAGFRAHQERFNRERDEYFSATLARLKATLNDRSSLRSEK
jgi:hypothetical protein